MSQTPMPALDHPPGPPAGAAISLRGLTKRYGTRVAVDGLTIDVPAGVVAGFVGPNGAGKTTTMAMLLGLVRPSEGGGTVLGRPLHDPASYLDGVGALIEGPAFYPGSAAPRTSPCSRPPPATTPARSRACWSSSGSPAVPTIASGATRSA